MIESNYSLVFVLVPGIQEFLKQHSRDDETCKMIRKAIQVITNNEMYCYHPQCIAKELQ